MSIISIVFGLFFTLAICAPVSLTADDFKSATEGKHVFVKFFAPWCGHCKKMAGDWDRLCGEYANSATTLIADVDCTQQQKLCQAHGIKGYPTIKYWRADETAQDYRGGRDFASLFKHAQDKLQ